MDDAIEIQGLTPFLDDEEDPLVLDLTLACHGRIYRAAILPAEEEWAVNMREAGGRPCPANGELYATQADAILAAMLTALELSRHLRLR